MSYKQIVDDDVDDDERFARQLKQLVSVLGGRCAAVNQPCDHDDDHAGGRTCCRGLRCSTPAGRCQLDCVADRQSCRHNWFCCDGRRCNRRDDDFVCE